MLVIDIRHWLDETYSGPALPQLKLKVERLCVIITYATSLANDIQATIIPRCRRRPKRKPCNEVLDIELNESIGQIHWYCKSCKDEGVITGWEGLIWDMSDAGEPVQ